MVDAKKLIYIKIKSSEWWAPYVTSNDLRTSINYVYKAEHRIGHLNIKKKQYFLQYLSQNITSLTANF